MHFRHNWLKSLLEVSKINCPGTAPGVDNNHQKRYNYVISKLQNLTNLLSLRLPVTARPGDACSIEKSQAFSLTTGDEMLNLPRKVKYVERYLKPLEITARIRGVYFLCQSNQVLYIGQSVNIVQRVGQHLEDKAFSDVYVLDMGDRPVHWLTNIEQFLI